MNLVKTMSLHEKNAPIDIDQQTELKSSIHKWRSMTLNQEETGALNSHRYTESLLSDQTWSK